MECKLEAAATLEMDADFDRKMEDGDSEVEDRERGRVALPGLPSLGELSLR